MRSFEQSSKVIPRSWTVELGSIRTILLLVVGIAFSFNWPILASADSMANNVAISVRVDADRGHPGTLYACINNGEVTIASDVVAAWLLDDGSNILYSGKDGAGGYENEGQSLHIYNASTNSSRKIFSAIYMIDKVTELSTRTGRHALLVEMMAGGLGASHLAVVDPRHGATFIQSQVKLLKPRGDKIILGRYRENDWEHIIRNIVVKPYKLEKYDIDVLIRRPSLIEPVLHTK